MCIRIILIILMFGRTEWTLSCSSLQESEYLTPGHLANHLASFIYNFYTKISSCMKIFQGVLTHQKQLTDSFTTTTR